MYNNYHMLASIVRLRMIWSIGGGITTHFLLISIAHSGEIDDKNAPPTPDSRKKSMSLCSQHPARGKSWGRLQYFTTFFERRRRGLWCPNVPSNGCKGPPPPKKKGRGRVTSLFRTSNFALRPTYFSEHAFLIKSKPSQKGILKVNLNVWFSHS